MRLRARGTLLSTIHLAAKSATKGPLFGMTALVPQQVFSLGKGPVAKDASAFFASPDDASIAIAISALQVGL